jgi:hypothetical protein
MSTLWDGEELTEFPSSAREHLRPMNAFDPIRPALVYDEMNDQFLKWRPEWDRATTPARRFKRPAPHRESQMLLGGRDEILPKSETASDGG